MKDIKNFAKRVTTDYIYGSVFFTFIGSAINFVYAVWQCVLAITYGSVWYIALTIYYGILCIVRVFTLLFQKLAKKRSGMDKLIKSLEYYRSLGIMMFVINAVFAVMAWLMVTFDTATHYTYISAIISAVYAFYKMTIAIINAARAKNYDNYVIRALRKLTLIDAIVSLFLLEAAMIETFGDGIRGSLFVLVFATGIVAIGACVGITVYMMIISSIKLRRLKNDETEKV